MSKRERKERPQYPPAILMVGGSRDGEFWPGAPNEFLQIAKLGAKPRAAVKIADPEAGKLETETYRLRQFGASNQVLVIYAIEGMDDFNVQLTLINGYRRL